MSNNIYAKPPYSISFKLKFSESVKLKLVKAAAIIHNHESKICPVVTTA